MSSRSDLPEKIKNAMRSRDQLTLDTLRFLLSLAKNAEIDLKRELSEEEFQQLLSREVKNRQDAIEQFQLAGRDDIVSQEESKLEIIRAMLPAQLSDEEIERVVNQVVASQDDHSFAALMKAVMVELKGKADGKRISKIVRKAAV